MITDEAIARDALDRLLASCPPGPDWSPGLAQRSVRRRRTRLAAAIGTTVAIVAAITIGTLAVVRSSTPRTRPAGAGPGTPSAQVMTALASNATRTAVLTGESWQTTDRQAIYVRTQSQADAVFRAAGIGDLRIDGPGYLIKVHGSFTCPNCDTSPEPHPMAHPNVLYGWMAKRLDMGVERTRPHEFQLQGFPIMPKPVDLARFGHVIDIPPPSHALTPLPIRLSEHGKHRGPIAGSAEVLDTAGHVVRTVTIPASGHATVTVPGGAEYVVRASRSDGSDCRSPIDPEVGVDRLPVFVDVHLPAYVFCYPPGTDDMTGITYINPDQRQVAPDLSGTTLDGEHLDVAGYRGHVVVVNFWGSWCQPCQREAAGFANLAKEYSGVRFVGIDEQDTPSAARQFDQVNGVRYPSITDPGALIAKRFPSQGPPNLPITEILDPQGRIAVIADRTLGFAHLKDLIDDVRFNHVY